MKNSKAKRQLLAALLSLFVMCTVFIGMGTSVSAATASSIAQVDTYGNFETAGVTVKVNNMSFNETATIEYKKTTDSTYKTGHYFVRYDGNHMATSLFNLALNTTYNIKVTLSDPDGVTGTNPYYTTVTTKAEYSLPTPLRIINVPQDTTFDSAIRNALPGDEIRLAAGTYTQAWDYYNQYDHSGTAANPIVITSQSSTKPLFTAGFYLINSNYIVLNNLEIHNESRNGVTFRSCHNNVVRNCYIHDSAPYVSDYTCDILICHSEGTEAPFTGIGNHLIINNVLSDEIHDPISDTNNGATAGQCYNGINFLYQPGGFNTVRGNTIYGVVDGANLNGDEGNDLSPDAPDYLNSWYDQNMDFYDNVIYNTGDDGIQNDGHMMNGRVFRNRIGNCKCGISTAPTYPGPDFFVWNYVYGFVEQGSKQNTGVDGIIRNCFFYQNTFVERDRTNDGAISSKYCFYRGEPSRLTNFTYKNNIFYARGRVYNGDMYQTDPTNYYYKNYTMDYNTMFSTRQTDAIYLYKWVTWYNDPLNNTRYSDFASFQSATGQEAHGTYGDPFVDITPLSGYPSNSYLASLRILNGSAAIDKGALIPGINDTYNGSAPDCGAYESNGSEPNPTPTPTPTATPTPTPTPTPIEIGSGIAIQNLGVYDFANAADWSIHQNLQVGDLCYGDRTATYGTVASYLLGKEYIRPANDSKTFVGNTLCTFTVSVDTDIYVAHNNYVGTHPAWLTSAFTNTGEVMSVGGNNCTLFKKTYSAGSQVDLGDNGNTSMSTYVVILNPLGAPTPTPTPTPVTITLQQGINNYSGGKDQGYLQEDSSSNAAYYGAGQAATLKFRDWNGISNALMYFNLSGQIPAGATIDSATLSLYVTGTGYTGGTCNMYRVIDPNNKGMWVEGTTSAQLSKNGAGWKRRSGTNNTVKSSWTNISGSTIMDSVVSTPTGNFSFGINSGWFASSDVKSDVQAWVNGTAVNQGWYIRALSGSGINIAEIASDQYSTVSYRPKLTITYH